MSDTITGLNEANSIDAAQDWLAIDTFSVTATQKINRNTLLNLTGNPVGDSDTQTLTNKTLTSPTISGPTLSGTISGTYTIGGTPTFPSSVATLTGSQTLTNKTLTSPIINSPTITNATITADAITGYSTSNAGSIFGVSISSGTIGTSGIANSAITTALINNGAITPSKLGTGAATAIVATSETSAVQTFGDNLSTIGPSVTVTIGANGLALVILYSYLLNNGANGETFASFIVSGANTQSAADNYAIMTESYANNAESRKGATFLLTGLTAGSTTFKMQYRVNSNTGTWKDRRIAVVPL